MKVVCVFVAFGLVTCCLLFGGHTVFKHLKEVNTILDLRVVEARKLVSVAEEHAEQLEKLKVILDATEKMRDAIALDLRDAYRSQEILVSEKGALEVQRREAALALAAAEEAIRLRDAAAEAKDAEFKARAEAAIAELSK